MRAIRKTGTNRNAVAGDMHRKLVKIGCVVFELCEPTDRHTYSSQYFAPPSRGQTDRVTAPTVHALDTAADLGHAMPHASPR